MIICDTSALLSALWADQPEHERCASILRTGSAAVIPPLVIAELDHLISQGASSRHAVAAVRHLAMSGFEMPKFSWPDVEEAVEVKELYQDLNIGLTDASLVVLAKRYKTNDILTLDQRHFRTMRGLDGRHFRLLPFDLEL